jgi:hypothetical protein
MRCVLPGASIAVTTATRKTLKSESAAPSRSSSPACRSTCLKDLGVDIKLRLHRVHGRDCLSIAIDYDDFAFISPEQARRIAEDLLAMANQAQTDT